MMRPGGPVIRSTMMSVLLVEYFDLGEVEGWSFS
jgi:hypothetical protein